ncbi:DUF6691 family protein [Balneola vulgaris]|uniref:DUF6691 family protein n=1 Tax=Balneola vulgaris TaxID=287535 RepID=UPI00035DB1DE|nr:DUF6691 family protein [Balneola vulgaris]
MRFLLTGSVFGFILVKSEVVSWFRIQEMFYFDSIHMYGVIGLAVLTGMLATFMIKKLQLKDVYGEPIVIKDKDNSITKRYVIGGTIFGLGWALTGACPGPMYALVGSGYLIFFVPLLSAILGAAVYGMLQHKLPH